MEGKAQFSRFAEVRCAGTSCLSPCSRLSCRFVWKRRAGNPMFFSPREVNAHTAVYKYNTINSTSVIPSHLEGVLLAHEHTPKFRRSPYLSAAAAVTTTRGDQLFAGSSCPSGEHMLPRFARRRIQKLRPAAKNYVTARMYRYLFCRRTVPAENLFPGRFGLVS